MSFTAKGRPIVVALAALVGVIGFGATLQALTKSGGVIVNTSASVPVGFYRARQMPAHLQRGSLVLSCALPSVIATGARSGFVDSGACPGGGGPLIKYVGGIPGDLIAEDASGVRVNRVLLAHSRPLHSTDVAVRWTPRRMRLALGAIWLYGSHPLSWDSRYFGPVPTNSVRAVLTPLWVPSGFAAHAISVIWGPCPQSVTRC